MKVSIPKDIQAYVQAKIDAGDFASPEDLVGHSLRVLQELESLEPSASDDLRREIDIGLEDLAAGRVADWDVDDAKRRLLNRLRKRKAS